MGKDTFTLAGREWPRVTWWKMKGMRSVYLTLWAAMITSATNGSVLPSFDRCNMVLETDNKHRLRWIFDERSGGYGVLEGV